LSPFVPSQPFGLSTVFYASNFSLGFLNLQIKKLDDTEFRNAFGRAYIRVSIVAYFDYWELLLFNWAPYFRYR
jgi:hypothetical protein